MCQNTTHNSTTRYLRVFYACNSFDKINNFKLFQKLPDRKAPIAIVRILLFWYTKQTVCIKWGTFMSDYFRISNGVRQGGILSPKLFSFYVDNFSDKLILADDICLMAPSPAYLRELINIRYDFRVQK